MRIKRSSFVVAFFAAAAITLTGCTTPTTESNPNSESTSSPAASDDLTFAVVSHGGPGDAFWDVVKSGAEQAGDDLDVNVTYQSDPDPVKQSQLINSAVASNATGIIVSMSNPDGVRQAVEDAVAAGIPVITINSGLEESKEFGAQTHVGQSELIAGEASGEEFAKSGGSKAICVIHEAGNSGLEDRCKGFTSTFGGDVENVQVDIANLADVQNTVKSKLLADPAIDTVMTLNSGIAVAAAQGIEEAGSSAKLGTFDVSSDVLDLVSSDKILFAIDQQPYSQGYVPVTLLALRARNGDVVGGGQPVYSGPGFVTKVAIQCFTLWHHGRWGLTTHDWRRVRSLGRGDDGNDRTHCGGHCNPMGFKRVGGNWAFLSHCSLNRRSQRSDHHEDRLAQFHRYARDILHPARDESCFN